MAAENRDPSVTYAPLPREVLQEEPRAAGSLAAVLFEAGRPLRFLPLSLPELKPGQALVSVAYSGVCQSQLLEVRGRRGPDRHLPHTLGHEGSGTVLEVGQGVSKVRAGDRVVLTWIKGTGADAPSASYPSPEGPVSSGPVSTFLERAVVSENRLVRIPETMPLREAALLGCAVPTGAGAILHSGVAGPGASVAVFGVGGIGLSAVLAARLLKTSVIIAVDVIPQKLSKARQMGATHLVNARERDPAAAVLELTGGRGLDLALEASGRREAMEAAIRAVREKGGLCILAGNLPQGERIALDPYDLIRGKRVMGTWGGETDPDRDIPRYADLCLAGELELEALIDREGRLGDLNRLLDELEQGQVARALVKLAP